MKYSHAFCVSVHRAVGEYSSLIQRLSEATEKLDC